MTSQTQTPFRFCLNTSTLRGFDLGIEREIAVIAAAGYDGVEPWLRQLDTYRNAGGSLADLGRRISDAGLSVEGAIGFFEWIVDDEERRGKALEQARRDMESVAAIGGTRIAAPPMGMTGQSGLDLFAAAERYAHLCEIGRDFGVVPMVEVWGFSQTLSRLGEAALIAAESGHPDACILADVYHLHKGGSPVEGLKLLRGEKLPLFHVNDYPAQPGREEIKDEHRVYPGDGVAPLREILGTLREIGFCGCLSLELFNPNYWTGDPQQTARTGLEKMRAAVENAGLENENAGALQTNS